MPRFIPKRPRTPEPPPDDGALGPAPAGPLPPIVPGRLRVEASFNCEGRVFQRGMYVMLSDPLVQRIWQEYPQVFSSAAMLTQDV